MEKGCLSVLLADKQPFLMNMSCVFSMNKYCIFHAISHRGRILFAYLSKLCKKNFADIKKNINFAPKF